MKPEIVARDNVMFFVAVVGMSLGIEHFAMAVLESSIEVSEFLADSFGSPGYIIIDSSTVRKKDDNLWLEFVDKIRGGLLTKVSYGFSSATKFEGDFSEKVTIKNDGYTFSFHIRQYERDSEHGFEIIDSENLDNVPEEEELGRVVYLTIETDK